MDRTQLRAARALLGWSQDDLARASGVSVTTLKRIEPGSGELRASPDVVEKIENALRSAGVELLDAEGERGRGVRMRNVGENDRLALSVKQLFGAEELLQSALASLGEVRGLRSALDSIRTIRTETQSRLDYLLEADELLENGTFDGISKTEK